MSQRFKIKDNVNKSKNTRLPINEDFYNYRFNRDELAHVSRYLFVCQKIIEYKKILNKPLNILDIGCGDIYIARVFQSSFHTKKTDFIKQYTGIDIDDRILQKVNETKPKSFPIEVMKKDITDNAFDEFKDKQFDLVICLETIEHIMPKFVPILLKEIKRIGKFAFISTPNFDGGTGKIPKDHIKEWGYSELKNIFDRFNIKIKNEIGIFCNLNKVNEICKTNKTVNSIYHYLNGKVDDNFLSIIMAKFIKEGSQNILRECIL